MNYFQRVTSKHIIIASIIALVSCLCIFGISYYATYQIIHPSDYAMNGKNQSSLAREIRSELLTRPNYEAVSFKSHDDITLSGILVLRKNPTANLLVSHGFKGSKEFGYGLCAMFPDWNILLYDFRAHGQSSGTLTTIGVRESYDVLAAAHFLRNTTTSKYNKKLPLIALGMSMGAASTLRAAELDPAMCDIIVADSAYADLSTVIKDVFSRYAGLPHYPFFPIAKRLFHYLSDCTMEEMSPVKSVGKIKQPILFIHSCADKFIIPENALKLYINASNRTSKLWLGPACRHGSLHIYHSEHYKKRVNSFVFKHLPMLSQTT